ncbi:hypothetical protein QTP88_017818 [Uroleucon formosanum]
MLELSKSIKWCMNGTFFTCPKELYQVYMTNACIKNTLVPCFYALLQRKIKDTYVELLSTLRSGGPQTNTPLKQLVKQSLKAFDELLREKGSLFTHQRHLYHQMSVKTGKSFLVTYHNPDLNVVNQQNDTKSSKRSMKGWLYKKYAELIGLKGTMDTKNFRAITWSKCVMPFTELQLGI